jgi:hypothetical protein
LTDGDTILILTHGETDLSPDEEDGCLHPSLISQSTGTPSPSFERRNPPTASFCLRKQLHSWPCVTFTSFCFASPNVARPNSIACNRRLRSPARHHACSSRSTGFSPRHASRRRELCHRVSVFVSRPSYLSSFANGVTLRTSIDGPLPSHLPLAVRLVSRLRFEIDSIPEDS